MAFAPPTVPQLQAQPPVVINSASAIAIKAGRGGTAKVSARTGYAVQALIVQAVAPTALTASFVRGVQAGHTPQSGRLKLAAPGRQ